MAGEILGSVAWVSQVGVESTESGQVTRTAAVTGAWDAGAVSQRAIRNGSDSVRGISAVCAGGYNNRMIGLNSQSTTDSTNYQSLDFAIFCTHTKRIKVYEKGKLEYTMAGTYSSSDSLQIVINDAGAVEYFKNKIRFYTSQQTPESRMNPAAAATKSDIFAHRTFPRAAHASTRSTTRESDTQLPEHASHHTLDARCRRASAPRWCP